MPYFTFLESPMQRCFECTQPARFALEAHNGTRRTSLCPFHCLQLIDNGLRELQALYVFFEGDMVRVADHSPLHGHIHRPEGE